MRIREMVDGGQAPLPGRKVLGEIASWDMLPRSNSCLGCYS